MADPTGVQWKPRHYQAAAGILLALPLTGWFLLTQATNQQRGWYVAAFAFLASLFVLQRYLESRKLARLKGRLAEFICPFCLTILGQAAADGMSAVGLDAYTPVACRRCRATIRLNRETEAISAER